MMNRPELFFSCVGGLGIDFNYIYQVLREELSYFNYELYKISLTSLLEDIPNLKELLKEDSSIALDNKNKINYRSESERVDKYTKACNLVRKNTRCPGVLSLLAINEINKIRKRNSKPNKAFFIISLKNPTEVEVFKRVYGNNFYLIAVYATKYARQNRLIKLFSKSCDSLEDTNRITNKYMDRDKEENLNNGQSVLKTYPKACYFISLDSLITDINRMTRLIFKSPFITPTPDELAMACSFTMSMRSGDLNRQVGAVITDSDGNILSAACNEIPKYGGGLFWPDHKDNRDHEYKVQDNVPYSEYTKKEIAKQIFNEVIKLTKNQNEKSILESVFGKDDFLDTILKKTELNDIIEFIRPVHAEEAAICDAARRGVSIKDAILYSTTFPCHLCAKKIIAVGIKRIVYIYPYTKSKAIKMYENLLEDKPEGTDCTGDLKKVILENYKGVSPRRFNYFYNLDLKNRKNKENKIITEDEIKNNAEPIYASYASPAGYLLKEQFYLSKLSEILKTKSFGKYKKIHQEYYNLETTWLVN